MRKPYKGYKGDGNAYMEEIYEEPKTGKWRSEIVSSLMQIRNPLCLAGVKKTQQPS